jgi:hypothetical protein
MIIMVAHFCGCGFHYLGIKNTESTNWLDKFDFRSKTVFEKYINSVYFAIITMNTVGYGDITP